MGIVRARDFPGRPLVQEETITAKPGIYVQVCFMQTQDGRDHTRLGMERIIKITK